MIYHGQHVPRHTHTYKNVALVCGAAYLIAMPIAFARLVWQLSGLMRDELFNAAETAAIEVVHEREHLDG